MTSNPTKTERLLILGSTGSIGTQTLQVVREHTDRFKVHALAAGNSWELLAKQALEFRPKQVVIGREEHLGPLKSALDGTGIKVRFGDEAILECCRSDESDLVVNSLVGFSGFRPTYESLKSGKRVALANKESLVVGGEILRDQVGYSLDTLMPVDSEHSAIWQCLAGEELNTVDQLVITASGGPFRAFTAEQLKTVTVDQALKHPNWSMGSKITIDSSTLMNKGLEIIEAYWLFGIPLSKIEAVVHPQSIIHSMVVFVDGSIKAQMGHPDMRLPIQYALSAPTRWALPAKPINWRARLDMHFEPVDTQRFPCLRLAREALEHGGFYPAVLNAANEVAVEKLLKREIPYIAISAVVEETMLRFVTNEPMSVESITHVDTDARQLAATIAKRYLN
jgi:1-deoxy-D-xylulose-5-phosphate reductoisomerase